MLGWRPLLALLIISAANQFFALGDWWHQPGKFNVADLGNVLAMLIAGLGLLFGRDRSLLHNPFVVLILLYVVMVAMHMSLAGLVYNQGIFQSLIGARHQFYYLSFFAFLVLLRNAEEVKRFLDLLAVVALLLFVLALVNYLGPTLFSHRWAEGHGVRAGIERGFIPGMGVVSFALIWLSARWAQHGRLVSYSGVGAILLLGAHVFRQTRSRLIAATAILVGLLIYKRRFKTLIVAGGLVFFGSAVWLSGPGSHIIVNLFQSSYEDLTQQEGTWVGRSKQLAIAWEEFKRHPVIGSGASVLRSGGSGPVYDPKDDPSALGYKADLGYAKWLASYGLLGVVWFIAFWTVAVVVMIRTTRRLQRSDPIPSMVGSYLGYVAISFLTINHFMQPDGIVLLMLLLAAVVRSREEALARDTVPKRPSAPARPRFATLDRGPAMPRATPPGARADALPGTDYARPGGGARLGPRRGTRG